MTWKKATWKNGKRKVSGSWEYNWASDTFTISLDSFDRVTGRQRCFTVHGDEPEWGNWKLERGDEGNHKDEGNPNSNK